MSGSSAGTDPPLRGVLLVPMTDAHLGEVAEIERGSFASPWRCEHFLHELHQNRFAVNHVALCNDRVLGYTSVWRVYGELGWGLDLRDERTQAPGRAEIGLEYQGSELSSKRRMKWYSAVDASFTEEREWQLDVSLQVGLLFASGDRRWRVAIDFYDGRVPLGEFFLLDQSWVGFGIWLDP